MHKKVVIGIVAVLLVFSTMVGCGAPQSNNSHSNKNGFIKGEPLEIISAAVKNLDDLTNFHATKNVIIKINGKETRAVNYDVLSNTSSIYAAAKTEIKGGNSKTVFKRIHLKNVQYEFDPEKNQWNMISRSKSPTMFTHSYYELNRDFALDIVNDIYSKDENQFGDFLKNIKSAGTETVNGYKVSVYSYSYNGSDDKRLIKRNGKIYIANINDKPFVVKVYDDNLITFKSNKSTVENITDLEVKNIGKAEPVAVEK